MTAGPLMRLGRHLAGLPRAIAAMLVIAAILSFVMAALAPINHSPELWRGPPDEHGHRGAARYYVDHWLPPKVGDPATLDSYSRDYGYSYINDPDPVYPLAGKFAAVVSPVVADPHRAFRLFNATLLAILAAICFARPAAALVFAPLTLSPQLWYVFSYFNNDALPLFAAVLLSWQVIDPGSAFNRFLDGPGLRRGWWGALGFALLVALLALSKKNFLSAVALVPALICLARFGIVSAALVAATALFGAAWYQGWFTMDAQVVGSIAAGAGIAALAAAFWRPGTRPARAQVVLRLLLLATLAAAPVVSRYWWDLMQHGSMHEKFVAQGVLQEKIAKPEYKPSTVQEQPPKSYYGLGLRARGTPLSALFNDEWAWHKKTFFTGTASYGWIQFFSPPWFYHALAVGYLAIFAVYAFAVVRARSVAVVAGFALVAAFSALTVGIALFHSWNNDFQAQGRYLFPIIAMFGAGLFMVRDRLPRATFFAALAYCFLLGLYSYIFTGLRYVPGSF